jgi:hypothetical protein
LNSNLKGIYVIFLFSFLKRNPKHTPQIIIKQSVVLPSNFQWKKHLSLQTTQTHGAVLPVPDQVHIGVARTQHYGK